MAIQVDDHEMRRVFRVIVVTDDGIGLVGAGASIGPIVLGGLPPREQHTDHHPPDEHEREHTHKKEQEETRG